MNKILFAILSIIPASLMAQTTVRMEIINLPAYHPSGSGIYAAGSFNGWNPQDEQYKFQQDKDGKYFLALKLEEGSYEYKITRGSWDNAECKKDGHSIANRLLKSPAASTVQLDVEEWQDRFPGKPKPSTASKQVLVMDTAFLIPQLKRARRVWIYLPKEYEEDRTKKYPVLYLQDGQNIFDDATSYSGEWGVDEFLDSTTLAKCIVVAIDHGAEKRLNEYNPYDHSKFGKGEGAKYVDFMVKTLKPYIDKRYRTLKQKKHTFIAGSSMGGLISLYAVLRYPRVFGGVGVFSPAFWISGNKIYSDIKKMGPAVNSRIYFYGGKLEGETMVPDMLKAFETMAMVSKSVMVTVIKDEGRHNEPTWRKEFPDFYKWILHQQ